HSAQSEEAVERSARYSEAVCPPGQLLDESSVRCHDRAADDIAVSVEIFRGGMDHKVSAEFDRSLEHRRQEGVVDSDNRPAFMPCLDHLRQIRHSQERIARRLDPQQLWPA